MALFRKEFQANLESHLHSCQSERPQLPFDANQGAGHADHTRENGAEVTQDPLSLPSGPITRLRAKRFKDALNGLIQETKMGSNNNQGLVHVIKAIKEDN